MTVEETVEDALAQLAVYQEDDLRAEIERSLTVMENVRDVLAEVERLRVEANGRIALLETAVHLLSSMVWSGETHTPESLEATRKALWEQA